MDLFDRYWDIPPHARGSVVALGNFDGVHRGHRAVIGRAVEEARKLGVPAGVVLFEPHPREFFAPGAPPFRLTRLETRARLLSALDVDLLFALPFDADLAAMSPQDFVFEVLIGGLGIIHGVAGADFCFGKARAGNMALLAYLGDMEGFGVSAVEPVYPGDEGAGHPAALQISSSAIRAALKDGEPERAARLLGRPWSVEGRVTGGDQRGRTIGFPTANVGLDGLLEPRLGVYAVMVEIFDGPHAGVYEGVANMGRRPTFGHSDVVLEAHLFDFAGDIYDAWVGVSLIGFLRPEVKFDGLESLKAQIRTDAISARATLAYARDMGILPKVL